MYIDARVRGWKWGDASKKSFAASSHRRRDRISLKSFFPHFLQIAQVLSWKTIDSSPDFSPVRFAKRFFTSRSGQQKKLHCEKTRQRNAEKWMENGSHRMMSTEGWIEEEKKKSHRCPPNINGVFLISLFVCVCVGNLRKSHNGADSGDCGKVGWTWSLDSIIIWSAGGRFHRHLFNAPFFSNAETIRERGPCTVFVCVCVIRNDVRRRLHSAEPMESWMRALLQLPLA
jgi:hypothetical protein